LLNFPKKNHLYHTSGNVDSSIPSAKIFAKIDIRSHGEMHRFITTLNKETQDSELLRHFSLAGALHQNFYENWLTPEMVVDHSRAVKSLVEKLKRLAG